LIRLRKPQLTASVRDDANGLPTIEICLIRSPIPFDNARHVVPIFAAFCKPECLKVFPLRIT